MPTKSTPKTKRSNPPDASQVQVRALKHRCEQLEEHARAVSRQLDALTEDLARLRTEVGAPKPAEPAAPPPAEPPTAEGQ